MKYLIFNIFDKNKPNGEFYMTYCRLVSYIEPLEWFFKEKRQCTDWWRGKNDRFMRSYLLFLENKPDYAVELVEECEAESERNIVERIKELCKGQKCYNNYGYQTLEDIFTRRLNHLKALKKDKERYIKNITEKMENGEIEKRQGSKKLSEIHEQLYQINKAIKTQEDFKTGDTKDFKKEDGKGVTTFDTLTQKAKSHMPPRKKR